MSGKSESVTAILTEDVYDVVSSWLTCKKPIPERWEGDTSPMYETLFVFASYLYFCFYRKALSCTEIQAFGKEGCSSLLSRARRIMLRIKSLCDTLSDLTSAIQAVSKVAEENFEAVGNMCGLALLPTELLARIFKFECVVNGDESLSNPSRWKAAFTL